MYSPLRSGRSALIRGINCAGSNSSFAIEQSLAMSCPGVETGRNSSEIFAPSPVYARAALDQPVRRDLYRLLSERDGWVTRDQASEALGGPRSVAAFHLERGQRLFDRDFVGDPVVLDGASQDHASRSTTRRRAPCPPRARRRS